MNEKLLILGMMLATFSVRYVMFGASSRIKLSPALLNALRYVPPVVLSAIVAPEVLLSDGALSVGLMNARLVGAIAAIILLLQYPIHQLGFTILSGAPETEQAGLAYFNARIWGAPAVLLNFVLIGWFLGREKNGVVFFISLMANGSNVLMDYLMINRWGWESAGAGLATALSQYLGLGVGLIAMALTVDWSQLGQALAQVLDRQSLASTLILKGNILVRFLALISAYSIFTNLSATFGTASLAENGLLLQIALLSQFTVQGVGMTAQTLIGNFNGKGQTDQCLPEIGRASCRERV